MKFNIDLKTICFTADEFDDNFVGIRFDNNEKKVIFPIGYRVPQDNDKCRLSILSLLKLISLSKKKLSDDKYGISDGDTTELPINSFLWIICDYLTNGVYFDIEKRYVQKQNGKINWKRTLKSEFYISNGNIVYLNPFVEKNINEKNYITDIHLFCINKSINEIGWLFGNIDCPKSNMKYVDTIHYKNFLNKEMLKTFDDRKKKLILHMKRILDYTTNKTGSIYERKYGTNQFEYIWEYIVDDVFGNDDVNKYFPSANWHILNWNAFLDTKLKPDTILSFNKKIYILDSKYYKFGISGSFMDLPHTDSIQKQITYGEYVCNNMNFKEIYNAFIVPYNKNNNSFDVSGDIEYIGFAESNWKMKSNYKNFYEHIALIFIDTKYIIDCYFKHTICDINVLIDTIEKVRSTF